MDNLSLAKNLALQVKTALQRSFFDFECEKKTDLKASNQPDRIAAQTVKQVVVKEKLALNLIIESCNPEIISEAECTLIADPLDGSKNFIRGCGDPAFVMAISRLTKGVCLKDLEFVFVEGLRSGDRYWLKEGSVYYYNAFTLQTRCLAAQPRKNLSNAIAYLRPGYGLAREQLEKTLSLFYLCRDLRAFDNAGMELCEIARGAADFMVEARGASENYNLIAAPILLALGGWLSDLEGNSLDSLNLMRESCVDYVAAATPQLGREIIEQLVSPKTWKSPEKPMLLPTV